MNKFNWGKALGYGAAIWAITAVLLAILGLIEPLNALWAHGIVAVTGGIAAYLFSRNVSMNNFSQNVAYTFVWSVIVVALDLAVTQWFDAHVFRSWQYWLGPTLVLLTPWIRTTYTQEIRQYA